MSGKGYIMFTNISRKNTLIINSENQFLILAVAFCGSLEKAGKLNHTINIKTKYIYMKYTLNNIQTFFNKNPVN